MRDLFLKDLSVLKSIGADKANVLYVVQGVIPGIPLGTLCVLRLKIGLFVWPYYEGMGRNEALGDEVCLRIFCRRWLRCAEECRTGSRIA